MGISSLKSLIFKDVYRSLLLCETKTLEIVNTKVAISEHLQGSTKKPARLANSVVLEHSHV